MTKTRTRRAIGFTTRPLCAAILGLAALVWSTEARADHSLGFSCISCHRLRSSDVVPGTRNILSSKINYDLYQFEWYCGGGTFVGGQPLDCTYCHGAVASEFAAGDSASGGNPPNNSFPLEPDDGKSTHPVYVTGQTGNAPSPRIKCNDCHAAVVQPDPNDSCNKGGVGYPNHDFGSGTFPYIKGEYGPSAANDWDISEDMRQVNCMVTCHDPDGPGQDVYTDYNDPNGGHSDPFFGNLTKKLGCYNCHAHHASANNEKLLNRGTGYVPGGDRDFCLTCHDGGVAVEGVTSTDVIGTWTPTQYPWHARVHDAAQSGGNCLGANGGCHQPHRNDISDCTSCHPDSGKDGVAMCDTCHGFPPIDYDMAGGSGGNNLIDRAKAPDEKTEDYQDHSGSDGFGGGGAHRSHVNLFWKIYDPDFDPTSESSTETPANHDPKDPTWVFELAAAVCGPCHGDNPGRKDLAPWHNEAGDGSSAVTTATIGNVDIRTRADLGQDKTDTVLGYHWGAGAYYQNDNTSQRMSDFGQSSSNRGGHVTTDAQICATLACHGEPDPDAGADPRAHRPEVLTWQDTVDSSNGFQFDQFGSKYRVSKKTAICKWCHDGSKARVVLRTKDGNRYYDSENSDLNGTDDPLPSGVVEAYFKPPSDFGRGGHGDGDLNDIDDPSFVDSAPLHTAPMDCVACHDETTADYGDKSGTYPGMLHFPTEDASSVHRLRDDLVGARGIEDLCNDCHSIDDYPGATGVGNPDYNHHPSFQRQYPTPVADVVPISSTKVYDMPPSGYSASNVSEDGDFFVDFWGGDPGNGTQGSTPTPSPDPVTPLEPFVPGPDTNKSRVMCVTCHNPHGTDLFVNVPEDLGNPGQPIPGDFREISDNNMLRVRDSDNTLCDACHAE